MKVLRLSIEFGDFVDPSNTAYITKKLMDVLHSSISTTEEQFYEKNGREVTSGHILQCRWEDPDIKHVKKHLVEEFVVEMQAE